MTSLRRVVALVQRFEAAAAATSPSPSSPFSSSPLSAAATAATTTTLCDADVAEGTVRELIAKFNGMARSMPDFPRPAYTRSMRAICSARVAVLEELATLTAAEPERSELFVAEGVVRGDELLALRCDGDAFMETATDYLGSQRDGDADDNSEDGVGGDDATGREEDNGDEEAGDDDGRDQVDCTSDDGGDHDDGRDDDRDDDNESLVTNDETASIHSLSSSFVSDTSCDDSAFPEAAADLYYELEYQSQARLHVQSEAEPAAALPEPIAMHVAAPKPKTHDAVETPSGPMATTPRTLLPSRIPIRRGSTLRAPSTPKAAALTPATRSEVTRPSVDSPPRSTGQRCDPSVPRSPATRKPCPRFAAASSPSLPRAQPKRSARRGSSSDIRTQVDAPVARRSSVTAPSARFHAASVAASANAPASQPQTASFVPINTRARSRSREASTRPPTPPVSSTLAAPNAELRLDGVKSRLFDYESDPKRLELVAANRARRKSLAPLAV